MMAVETKEKSDWDIEWDYSMGLLEDNGFEKTIVGLSPSSIMTDDGQLLKVTNREDYVMLAPPITTCKKAVAEAIANFNDITTRNGFRFLLSNGEYGCQLFVNKSKGMSMLYDNGVESKISIFNPIILNTDYKIKMEFDENTGNKIYINDELVYETTNFSAYYCTNNRLFQQSVGATYLKSLKYKFYE